MNLFNTFNVKSLLPNDQNDHACGQLITLSLEHSNSNADTEVIGGKKKVSALTKKFQTFMLGSDSEILAKDVKKQK
jgi:hypothetical protein